MIGISTNLLGLIAFPVRQRTKLTKNVKNGKDRGMHDCPCILHSPSCREKQQASLQFRHHCIIFWFLNAQKNRLFDVFYSAAERIFHWTTRNNTSTITACHGHDEDHQLTPSTLTPPSFGESEREQAERHRL